MRALSGAAMKSIEDFLDTVMIVHSCGAYQILKLHWR